MKLFPLLFLTLLISAWLPAEEKTDQTASVQAKVLSILDEFASDKFSANKKYKGKMVIFTEKVSHSSVDQQDKLRLYIEIGVNRGAVVCYFKDDENDIKAHKLKMGETVTIVGTLKVGQGDRLEFFDCVINPKQP